MKKLFIIFFLISLSFVFAKDISIPKTIKSSIIKQYAQSKIKFLSIKKIKSKRYQVIVKTDTGEDKIVITIKGKILSISDYLVNMEPEGGC